MRGGSAERTVPRSSAQLVGVALVRVHGGCGVSSCVRLLDPDRIGKVQEIPVGGELPADTMPVLVARSTAIGMRATAVMLKRWHESGLPRPGLLVVADAPWRYPSIVRYRLRALSSQVSGIVRMPYLYQLRALDDPASVLQYRRVARLVARVSADLEALAQSTTAEWREPQPVN